MGRSQVVRLRFLVPPFVGSSPSAPDNFIWWLSVFYILLFLHSYCKIALLAFLIVFLHFSLLCSLSLWSCVFDSLPLRSCEGFSVHPSPSATSLSSFAKWRSRRSEAKDTLMRRLRQSSGSKSSFLYFIGAFPLLRFIFACKISQAKKGAKKQKKTSVLCCISCKKRSKSLHRLVKVNFWFMTACSICKHVVWRSQCKRKHEYTWVSFFFCFFFCFFFRSLREGEAEQMKPMRINFAKAKWRLRWSKVKASFGSSLLWLRRRSERSEDVAPKTQRWAIIIFFYRNFFWIQNWFCYYCALFWMFWFLKYLNIKIKDWK